MRPMVFLHRRWIGTAVALVATVSTGLAAWAPVAAQGSTGVVTMDAPGAGAVATAGQPVFIGGWAVDPSGLGTGVNGVDIYLDGPPSGGGRLLGSAQYGARRADVAAAFGRPQLTNSGFDFVWVPRDVSAGSHTLYVAARTQAGTVAVGSVDVTVMTTTAAHCSFIRPCVLRQVGMAWEVDYGGPGTRFEYINDAPDRL